MKNLWDFGKCNYVNKYHRQLMLESQAICKINHRQLSVGKSEEWNNHRQLKNITDN